MASDLVIASSPWLSVYVPAGGPTVSLVPAAATAARNVVQANAPGTPGYAEHEPAPSPVPVTTRRFPSARADSTATSVAAAMASRAKRTRRFMAPVPNPRLAPGFRQIA